jgi:Domain of unknown function (DUF4062)
MAAIYVSSTYIDLKDHRAAVRDTLRRLGHVDIAMEYYVPEKKRPLARCLNDVKSCDLYIGILAWRYGYVPAGSERSITEMELREALRCEKETLLFLVARDAEWPAKYRERGEGKRRLKNLRAEIEAKFMVDSFSSPDDLSARVASAVAKWGQPDRTPQEVEREDRLMRSWLSPTQRPFERERARQALRNMASVRYIAMLRQFVLDQRGTHEELSSYLADIVALCSARPETLTVLLDLFEHGDTRLKRMAIFHLGELWLAGREVRTEVLNLLPKIAGTKDKLLLNSLFHAIDKLTRVHRYGETDEPVPTAIIECVQIMASVPGSPLSNHARYSFGVYDTWVRQAKISRRKRKPAK